nr:MAG TPA: Putative transmembrane protein precursor [Caudoviricetes sp.]
MHTVEHTALVQAAAYGKHRTGALCGKTVDIDLSGYFITYDRQTPQRPPAKLPGVCAPCPACRGELEHA